MKENQGEFSTIDQPTQRAIAFIDILGFSELVLKLDNDPSLIRQIKDVMNTMARTQAIYETKETTRRISIFSDTIIISDERRELGFVLLNTRLVAQELLDRGVLSRGAVIVGNLFHQGNIIFGSGLVEAYRTEQSLAIYPRILLDQELAEIVSKWQPSHSFITRWDNVVRQDVDGLWFLDVFAPPYGPPIHANNLQMGYVKRFRYWLSRNLITELEAQKPNYRNIAKIRWAINQFNSSLSRYSISEVEPIDIAQGKSLSAGSQSRRIE